MFKRLLKCIVQGLYAVAEQSFDSFKQLWQIYALQCKFLSLYCQLEPRECWLRKLTAYWVDMDFAAAMFDSKDPFCGVYAWVSLETSRLYLGSTIDFKQRIYCHVLSVRRTPKQHVHRFMRLFGRSAFIPVPLFSCPAVVLRQVEQSCIKALQPALNREWVNMTTCSRRGISVAKNSNRGLICQRTGTGCRPLQQLCTASLLPGGLTLPSVASALAFAWKWKLKTFDISVNAGSVHLPARSGYGSMFDNSVVSVEGVASLQRVPLSQCASLLSKPIAKAFILHVHNLSAVGWQLWALDTLHAVIRQPCTVKTWYKLSQLSFLSLFTIVSSWEVAKERQKLCQLVCRICKKVHKVDLSWRPLVRLPFGMQDLHPHILQFTHDTINSAPGVQHCIKQHWIKSLRIVQKQGRSVGNLLGNFRSWCKQLDCSPDGDACLQPFIPQGRLGNLPTVQGLVSFRGDDSSLPAAVRRVTGMHVKFIPQQGLHKAAAADLAEELFCLRDKLGVPRSEESLVCAWLCQTWSAVPRQRHCRVPGGIHVKTVLRARNMLKGLVGAPIDKNRILYFCDVREYRQRLISVFIEDSRHYRLLPRSEQELLSECAQQYDSYKWSRFCGFKQTGSLGYAQCLPKDKDCSLNRPIVPNCGHPLARLFNMAARAFAYMLQNAKFSHYNLFTTQQLVSDLARFSQDIADLVGSGEVIDVWLAQSDIKDMYTEIQHVDIENCVMEVHQRWCTARMASVLTVAKSGRQGVSPGYTKNPRSAASMPVLAAIQILLYELKHTYFHVGCSHIMQQIIGVSMGSKGGPALAWCVCMVNEIRFHESLGVDNRYIRVCRYFDDVLQLLLVPSQYSSAAEWVSNAVAKLQSCCYPPSLRLLRNSLGQEADMLSCRVFYNGTLHCMHKCKNAKYVMAGQQPRFAIFVPYASAHACRKKVMRTNLLGLLHRLLMDTLPSDVPGLLPVLQCYTVEMRAAGYPVFSLLSAYTLFLKHPKVVQSQQWRKLYMQYAKWLKSSALPGWQKRDQFSKPLRGEKFSHCNWCRSALSAARWCSQSGVPQTIVPPGPVPATNSTSKKWNHLHNLVQHV